MPEPKQHAPEFKAKVALKALKGEQTGADLPEANTRKSIQVHKTNL